MSEISGYWSYSCSDLPAAQFARFTHSLTYRGPDGFGIERIPAARLWLGHRRLEMSNRFGSGRQRMAYAEERY
jgi:asparagine synthetase B (glutamine-hydrolysing)